MKIIKNLNFFKFYTLLFSLPVSKSTRTIISYKCNEYLLKDDFNLNNLISCLNKLLKKNELKKINKNYKLLKSKLGGKGASKKTAQLIFTSLK